MERKVLPNMSLFRVVNLLLFKRSGIHGMQHGAASQKSKSCDVTFSCPPSLQVQMNNDYFETNVRIVRCQFLLMNQYLPNRKLPQILCDFVRFSSIMYFPAYLL